MSSVARRIGYGVLGGMTMKVTRRAASRALHDRDGAPRLPNAAKRRQDLGVALMLAAVGGVVLALSDLLREQRKEVGRRP